ncbi:MAG TPA: tetratricopeptide repeat protein [Kofleriaceae bacterium]|nr:tetratricopeptide repeat protein [Kofleriaceae bacterium]
MPPDFVERGRKLCAGSQFQEAVKVCRLGLLANPTEIEGRLVLGKALMALSRFDEVLAEMRVTLELDTDNPRALALKGQALLRKGDALQASDVLARAMAARPSDPEIRELYGEARRMREGVTAGTVEPAPLAPPPRALRGMTVPPDAVLAVGDKSGTIEIDPEIEGVEMEHTGRRLPTQEVSESSIELSTSDLLPAPGSPFESVDGPFAPRSAAHPALPAAEVTVDQPIRRTAGWGASAVRAPAAPVRPPPAAHSPPIEEMFPEDEDGVSSLELIDPATGLPRSAGGGDGWPPGVRGAPQRSRTEDMRMIRQGLGLSPEGSSPGRSMPNRQPQPMPVFVPPAAPGMTQLPPTDPRARRPPAPGPQPRISEPRYSIVRKKGIPLFVYALLALLVVGSAVLIGFKVRNMRLEEQIESAVKSADRAAARDTWAGYTDALLAYERVVDAQDSAGHRAARAAIAARMAAELGEGYEQAGKLVAGLGQSASQRALAARGYLALADGDPAGARAAAAELAKANPGQGSSHYLNGRAALLEGRASEAAEALRKAAESLPRPSVFIALARAEAALGRQAEAMAALEKANQLVPGHPHAAIWRARIIARGGALPSATEPEATLEAIIADSRLPADKRKLGTAPGQAAWAALALAEVKLARGDRNAARAALAGAQGGPAPRDTAFRTAMIEILVDFGDVAAARAQVDQAVAERPPATAVRVLAARVAMASGDTAGAVAALDQAGDISKHPEALALRGRIRLLEGSYEQAAADLDAALALRADLPPALVARAEVDLAKNDPSTAQKRLQPLYGDGASAPLEVVTAYAAAMRMSGDVAGARTVLTRLGEQRPADANDRRVLVEQARVERADGAFDKAADLYLKAAQAAPGALEPRLEAAALAMDRGDPASARAQLDALEKELGSGPVLVEAARVHIATGDHAGASALLDRAAKASAPAWKLARERGRLLLRQFDHARAVVELERAKSLEPDDQETRVLLMQAYVVGKNERGAQRELQDVIKGFRGSAIVAMARGMEALVREKPKEAAGELARAYTLAADAKASPRELGRAAYWVGRAHYLDGDLRKAGDWLQRSLSRDPSQADAHFLVGQIAYENGKGDAMLRSFQKSVELDPAGNPSAWYFIGEHHAGKKRTEPAKAALQTYLDRWPAGDFAADAKDLLAKLR